VTSKHKMAAVAHKNGGRGKNNKNGEKEGGKWLKKRVKQSSENALFQGGGFPEKGGHCK